MTLALQLLALAGIGYLALTQHRHHQRTEDHVADVRSDVHEVEKHLDVVARSLDEVHGHLADAAADALRANLKANAARRLEPAGAEALHARQRDIRRAHAEGISDAAARVRRFADVRTHAHGRADDKAITLRGLASHLEAYARQDRS